MKKGVIAIVLSFIFMMVLIFSYFGSVSSDTSKVGTQDETIANLKSLISSEKSEQEKASAYTVMATTGLNQARVDKDNDIAKTFIESVMTWDSYDQYVRIRRECMEKYGLDENSEFMKAFLPPVTNSVLDGKNYNQIDTVGLNVQFEDMDTYVTDITGDIYFYFAFVTWSSHDTNGAEAETTSIFTYKINSDGMLLNVDASTIQN